MELAYVDQDLIIRQAKDFSFTQSLIQQELNGLFGSETLRDLKEIIGLYDIYEQGAAFDPDNQSGDYVPADHRFRQIAALIDKEARFLFSQPPTITLEDLNGTTKDSGGNVINRLEANQTLVNQVL